MSDREAGTLAWSFDDLRRQIDIIEEAFEEADRDPVVLRGFSKGGVEIEAAAGDREYLSLDTTAAFGEDAFARPNDISGLSEADHRLLPLVIVPAKHVSQHAKEMVSEGSDD
ncbi:hypothetical protein [Halorubrum tebenquichense]|uniref:Uncharacterized protein n=1 Tax=Halorubrum tebenquichense DSM 14210 TaxID=1227485 RepID=M0E0X7_9EURY|nr:hypothetical protein [Halorubrum tebenquichense]ELZ40698.1 hypothetical protein C472_01499 [Halorubrum tebenquichense DSM 14210]